MNRHEALYPTLDPRNPYHRKMLEELVKLLEQRRQSKQELQIFRKQNRCIVAKAKKWLSLPVTD